MVGTRRTREALTTSASYGTRCFDPTPRERPQTMHLAVLIFPFRVFQGRIVKKGEEGMTLWVIVLPVLGHDFSSCLPSNRWFNKQAVFSGSVRAPGHQARVAKAFALVQPLGPLVDCTEGGRCRAYAFATIWRAPRKDNALPASPFVVARHARINFFFSRMGDILAQERKYSHKGALNRNFQPTYGVRAHSRTAIGSLRYLEKRCANQ